MEKLLKTTGLVQRSGILHCSRHLALVKLMVKFSAEAMKRASYWEQHPTHQRKPDVEERNHTAATFGHRNPEWTEYWEKECRHAQRALQNMWRPQRWSTVLASSEVTCRPRMHTQSTTRHVTRSKNRKTHRRQWSIITFDGLLFTDTEGLVVSS